MKFFYFIAIFVHINQPYPKWQFFYENQAHEVNLPKMGKYFTTIVGQSGWLHHCYGLSCLTYGQSRRHKGVWWAKPPKQYSKPAKIVIWKL